MFQYPPTKTHWLGDEQLVKANRYLGAIARIHGSRGDGRCPPWMNGAFEGLPCTVLQVLQTPLNLAATVRFDNGTVVRNTALHYLTRVAPYAELQYALVLKGQHKGRPAKLRQQYGDQWLVSVKLQYHFEIETDGLVLMIPDLDLRMYEAELKAAI